MSDCPSCLLPAVMETSSGTQACHVAIGIGGGEGVRWEGGG